jgi:hypothetical protein
MKLEYLDDINDGGKFEGVVSDNLVRLYDFDDVQTRKLIKLILTNIITNKNELNLSQVDFIETINCTLILQLSATDIGISKSADPNNFVCSLTQESFNNMIQLMEKVTSGYNWLCDTSNDDIDFLYSKGGTW